MRAAVRELAMSTHPRQARRWTGSTRDLVSSPLSPGEFPHSCLSFSPSYLTPEYIQIKKSSSVLLDLVLYIMQLQAGLRSCRSPVARKN